jgi:hypothetical protein
MDVTVSSTPIGYTVRAQVVQQQDLRVQGRAVGFLVGRVELGVVAGADAVEQVLVIAELPSKPFSSSARNAATARCVLPVPGSPSQQPGALDSGTRARTPAP